MCDATTPGSGVERGEGALHSSDYGVPEGFRLIEGADGLCLENILANVRPLRIDFTSAALTIRRKSAGRKSEAIARAVGISPGFRPHVLDATAGLGTDSFILASLGCTVEMFEQSPLIGLLLQDGLHRAQEHPVVGPIIQRMHLQLQDSCVHLKRGAMDTIDVVYLDPMFPPKRGAALAGREMQFLHAVLPDEDSRYLIRSALECGVARIVLKRPRYTLAPSPKPNFTINQKACRFDVFLR